MRKDADGGDEHSGHQPGGADDDAALAADDSFAHVSALLADGDVGGGRHALRVDHDAGRLRAAARILADPAPQQRVELPEDSIAFRFPEAASGMSWASDSTCSCCSPCRDRQGLASWQRSLLFWRERRLPRRRSPGSSQRRPGPPSSSSTAKGNRRHRLTSIHAVQRRCAVARRAERRRQWALGAAAGQHLHPGGTRPAGRAKWCRHVAIEPRTTAVTERPVSEVHRDRTLRQISTHGRSMPLERQAASHGEHPSMP